MDKYRLRLELGELQDRYINTLDTNRLEEWPELFVEDCLYEIMPKENEDMGLPIPLIRCDSRGMLRDRVISLRHANIYEAHTYRHMVSGLECALVDAKTADMQSNYLVVKTGLNGESGVYQVGRYIDRVVMTEDGWRYKTKRAIYDTLRVQTLLATPI